MIYVIWISLAVLLLVSYVIRFYRRFSRHGVKNLRAVPLVGNIGNVLFSREHMTEYVSNVCETFNEEKFIGSFEFTTPVVFVKDLEVLKNVAVRDFDYFMDHMTTFDENIDPFFAHNLFVSKGQKWKDMRSTLSPAFTSSKIRLMIPFMLESVDQMITYIKKKQESSGKDGIEVEAQELLVRCANDIIASCAFGIKVNTYTDEQNHFFKMARFVTNLSKRHMFLLLGSAIFPDLIRLLKMPFFPDDMKTLFTRTILDTMKTRTKNNIVRNDMIHLLIKAKYGKLLHEDVKPDTKEGFATVQESELGKAQVTRSWTDLELVAQAVVFYVASLDTVTSALGFTMYELATNPDIQERLYQEILQNEEHNKGKLDYESIQRLTYLDMVVSEALRLWPPLSRTERRCVKDYNLGKPNANSKEDFIIRKGEGVIIPIWYFHRNPEYYPNPDTFDPERFSEENRHQIKPATYMPFGIGPRNCIGSRFALCEVKLILYHLLLNNEVSPGEKTKVPLKLENGAFNMKADGGFWARLTPRQKTV